MPQLLVVLTALIASAVGVDLDRGQSPWSITDDHDLRRLSHRAGHRVADCGCTCCINGQCADDADCAAIAPIIAGVVVLLLAVAIGWKVYEKYVKPRRLAAQARAQAQAQPMPTVGIEATIAQPATAAPIAQPVTAEERA